MSRARDEHREERRPQRGAVAAQKAWSPLIDSLPEHELLDVLRATCSAPVAAATPSVDVDVEVNVEVDVEVDVEVEESGTRNVAMSIADAGEQDG